MAEDVDARLEGALKMLIGVTEKSGNLRNDLKQEILKAVKQVRGVYNELKSELSDNHANIKRLETTLADCKRSDKSSIAAPSTSQSRPLYSQVIAKIPSPVTETCKFTTFVQAKNKSQSTDYIKAEIKSKINPAEIKVGISGFKSLRNGKIAIESTSQKEIELLSRKINEHCPELEATTKKRFNPRIVVFDVGPTVTIDNAAEIISSQNADLNIYDKDIQPQFVYENKKSRKTNLVVEVTPEVRNKLLGKKLKIGWEVCRHEDYIRIKRCFKCSKFNHTASNCRGKLTCPVCAEEHRRNECKATAEEYKCVNCSSWNQYNKDTKVNENHSSLDNNCGCYQNAIKKYKQNINYS